MRRRAVADVGGAVEPLASVEGPVEAWTAATDDEWLKAEAKSYAEIGGPWAAVCAAGLVERLAVPGSNELVSLTEWLDGGTPMLASSVRRWSRELSREQVATIEDLAIAETESLHSEFEALEDDFRPGEASWWRSLVRVLHRRDDIESAVLLLGERATRLGVALAALDETGKAFVGVLPRVELPDERLERVLLGDPDAWWALPVSEG